MELVVFLNEDKESWNQGYNLIMKGDWEKIIVIGGLASKNFSIGGKNFEFVEASLGKKLIELKQELLQRLKGKIDGTEVALSIASGNGKEHMALISALLSLPTGIRFTAITREGIVFL